MNSESNSTEVMGATGSVFVRGRGEVMDIFLNVLDRSVPNLVLVPEQATELAMELLRRAHDLNDMEMEIVRSSIPITASQPAEEEDPDEQQLAFSFE